MRLHLLSLPHTQTTSEYLTCAYTQKVVKFCRMMHPDWDIVLYSGEENEAPCSEHVPLISEKARRRWFGKGFDTVLTPLEWTHDTIYWRTFNGHAIAAIAPRYNQGDKILLSTGTQWIVHSAYGNDCCEPFVGYEGIATPFCAYESSSFMHTVYAKRGIGDGRNFDAVIPNFFDLNEFPHVGPAGGDYLLFIGRLIRRKGIHVAVEIAKAANMKLLIAGPGATEVTPGRIVAPDISIEGDVEYLGPVGVKERSELMAHARAVLVPTDYLEPFGGVAVEAQLSGTPAITTDWGAFRETVEHGVTGFRFRNLAGALDAVDQAPSLNPELIRRRAEQRFSLQAVRPLYEEWFGRLASLAGKGWYEPRPTDANAKVPA